METTFETTAEHASPPETRPAAEAYPPIPQQFLQDIPLDPQMLQESQAARPAETPSSPEDESFTPESTPPPQTSPPVQNGSQPSQPTRRRPRENHRTAAHDASKRAEIFDHLLKGWKVSEIAERCNVGKSTIYNLKNNLVRYGSVKKPSDKVLGRPPKLKEEDKQSLLSWMLVDGWKSQDDMIAFFKDIRGVKVDRATISRLCKKQNWSQKSIQSMQKQNSKEISDAVANSQAQQASNQANDAVS